MIRARTRLALAVAATLTAVSASCSTNDEPVAKAPTLTVPDAPATSTPPDPGPLFAGALPELFCETLATELDLPYTDTLTYQARPWDGDPNDLDAGIGYECHISSASSAYTNMGELDGSANAALVFKRIAYDPPEAAVHPTYGLRLHSPPEDLAAADWAQFITVEEPASTTFTCYETFNEGCAPGDETPAEGTKFVLKCTYTNLSVYAAFHFWGDAASEGTEALVADLYRTVVTQLVDQMEREQ